MDEWLDFSELVDRSQELIELGLFDEAKALLDRYKDIFNDEWELHFLYSRILTDQNKPREAIPCLHRGLALERTNVDCLLGLFYAYSMMNEVKRAGRYLLRAAKYHPDNEAVLSGLVWYYTEMNDVDKAIEYVERMAKNGTSNPEAYRNSGLAYERAGQYEDAERCFRTALEFNPQFDEVRDLLVDHYLFLGEHEKAIALCKDALKESPNNIRLMSRLVFCLSQTNQTEEASAIAKETVRLYPNSPIGYIDLAYIHLNLDDPAAAVAAAEKALDISPIDPEAYRAKAIAYSELDNKEETEKAFETAISLNPENPEIIRDYYHYLRDSGDFDKMEGLVKKVIEMEEPYCMEDYWFLAEYYREEGQNLKAFRYLHDAYKCIPAEKELIPPIIDILLDQGHARYSFPFLAEYVKKSGWNEVMNRFVKHARLRGKKSQEGLRFLRFFGQRGAEYHRYIFWVYLEKFVSISGILLIASLCVPAFLIFGIPGPIALAALGLSLAGAYYLTRHVTRNNFKKIITVKLQP